jgi:hypothetical protein
MMDYIFGRNREHNDIPFGGLCLAGEKKIGPNVVEPLHGTYDPKQRACQDSEKYGP